MYNFEWNEEKNEHLKKTRGISFDDVIHAVNQNKIIDIIDNPKRKNQRYLIVEINNYAIVVPFVRKEDNTLFLKTLFPSRKFTKQYLKVKKITYGKK